MNGTEAHACVQKRGTAGPYVLHVTRNSNKSSPEIVVEAAY